VKQANKRPYLLPFLLLFWLLVNIGELTRQLLVTSFQFVKFGFEQIVILGTLIQKSIQKKISSKSIKPLIVALSLKCIELFSNLGQTILSFSQRQIVPKIKLFDTNITRNILSKIYPKTATITRQAIYRLYRFVRYFTLGLVDVVLIVFQLTKSSVLFVTGSFKHVFGDIKNYLWLIQFPPLKKKKARGRPKKKPKYAWLAPLSFKLSVFLLVIAGVIFVYSYFIFNLAHQLPSPEKLADTTGPMTTTFYDRSGRVLYRLYEDKNRSLVRLEDLPSNLVNATIAIEDKNFYHHAGIDLEGVGRAVVSYVKTHRALQGGSTITQQLIKNTLLTPDRTWERKAKEVALAFWTERLFNKQQILQMYFNEVPYGGPAWGIAAAAQTYFGKAPKDLDLAESAYIAGLPASPTSYSPYGTNPQFGKDRQREVLRRMVEDKYITQTEADVALAEQINIKSPMTEIKAPHFVMYLRSLLSQKYGERMVMQGGLKVITTLDLNIQEMAEQVVAEEIANLKELRVSNGAAMVTDAKTGQILAMVGSKNYWDETTGKFNVATADRQPGSSIKPITYATGFEQGYTPGTILLDTPVVFKNEWETYAPVNYDGRFHGAVPIRTALGSSYNIPAVKMLSIVGIDNMLKTAHAMGITTLQERDRYGLSLTLGGGEVKLVDMMTVYGTFSQNGVRFDSQPVLKITDSLGNVLEDNSMPVGKRVISSAVAYLISNILADNKARMPAFGPNSLLNIPGHTVAVKTGTTDSKRDNWCFGFTPDFVVGAWVGNNDNSTMDQRLASGVTGASPIWNKIITKLLEGKPDVAFAKPPEVIEGMIDGRKDLMIAGTKPKSIIGSRPQNSPDGKQNITFTDPFSTYTLEAQPNR
jgi:1A family penicillin-binding protein